MFKRAHLFNSNVPLVQEGSGKSDQNEIHDLEDIRSELDKPEYNIDDEGIRTSYETKVAHCIHCKGKTMLNEDSINKHIQSKNHIKNVKKNLKKREAGNKIRKEFNKRMEAIDRLGKL
ncbi:hypothetical protein BEWA_007770 [Theileria equi strain WA]|uniref:Uncharacterized protein n=1 Tax=Theileria equi strain WA TaxID=1537102 RepID=L0B1J8_THEEQ|nr:hypothetical protein BEWA_007770 [Theileria equi strain WA]AFZ81368.1 hypothetical protein BEWA_007770 [Theileria equi strain WA]|eukprot:XP_004831034.1 hypothetical protein BEWA_007770 [Theileria equi strain WA]